MTVKEFHINDTAIVDGKPWYTIVAARESAAWVRQQDTDQWYHTHSTSIINLFDISEELLLLMKLKWPV